MMLMRRSHAPPQRICVAQGVEHVTEETVELHARVNSVILELGPLQVRANIVLELKSIKKVRDLTPDYSRVVVRLHGGVLVLVLPSV